MKVNELMQRLFTLSDGGSGVHVAVFDSEGLHVKDLDIKHVWYDVDDDEIIIECD